MTHILHNYIQHFQIHVNSKNVGLGQSFLTFSRDSEEWIAVSAQDYAKTKTTNFSFRIDNVCHDTLGAPQGAS